jgi:hypothetical protein
MQLLCAIVLFFTPKFRLEGMSKLIRGVMESTPGFPIPHSVMTPGGHFVSPSQTPYHLLPKLLMDGSATRIT